MQYQIVEILIGDRKITNIKMFDGVKIVMIPCDMENTDYQSYLAWLAKGNTPLPPDEETR